MAETQETAADITAKMRNYSNECNDGYHTDYGVVCEDMRDFADRFDAAIARERADCAKLREAAETALKTIRGVINSTISPRSNTVFDCRDKLSAALSATEKKGDAK